MLHHNEPIMVDSVPMIKHKNDEYNLFHMFNFDIQLSTNQQYMVGFDNIEYRFGWKRD